MFELLSERMYVSHCLVLFCINLHPPQVDTAGLSLSNTTTKSILHNIRFPAIVNTLNQGRKSWQPFGKRKNGHKIFVRPYLLFCDKFILFARDCKFANPIEHNTQYIQCNSALLAQETLFLPKVLQKVHYSRQIFKIS